MAGAESGFVVFQRGETDDSDAWDDTALIKAYDEAVSAVKAKLNGSDNEEANETPDAEITKHGRGKKKKNKHKNKPRKRQKWKVGDSCRAKYSEDDYVYNAKIMSLDTINNTCIVQYIDYGNEEEQNIAALLPPVNNTEDKITSASETESIEADNVDASTSKPNHSKRNYSDHYPPLPPFPGMMMPPPFPPGATGMLPGFRSARSHRIPTMPPPPPPFYNDNIEDDEDALSCMLISWYMSGYHTGYYQGLKQGKQQSVGKGYPSGIR